MGINKNHEFEELNGIKCGIVEKNVSPARAEFLKKLLEYNQYTVVVAPSPSPKAGPVPVAKTDEGIEAPPLVETPPAPETFTIGVTDTTFNPINAIFGRLLKSTDGHVVTQAYWYQKESSSHDEVPYYEHTPVK